MSIAEIALFEVGRGGLAEGKSLSMTAVRRIVLCAAEKPGF
jgi:hypothetical protein